MTNHSTTSKNPFDIFIVGLRKGLDIGLYSLLPNVLMAFVLTYMLNLFGGNAHDVTILAPAFILMASQIQYMGRLLGVANCPKKYWPLLMFNSVFMACLGMIVMRFVA